MAGFELIVRPMIIPDIRPAARQSIAPVEADPEKGLVVIRGTSAKTIELPFSYNLQWSAVIRQEVERLYDVQRVYQKVAGDEGGGGSTRAAEGGVNRSNYVDVEVARRITMADGSVFNYGKPLESDSVETIDRNLVRRQ